MRETVERHPTDIFANLELLALYREQGHDDVIASYRAAREAHPGDPRRALFYAASLIGVDTPAALRQLSALASAEFPYPYLLIGHIHSYPRFHDKQALSTNLLRFVNACPSYLPGYELLAYAGVGDELAAAARHLRSALAGRSGPDAVAAYRWLWSLEFRVAPQSEHASLRARVAQDIASLNIEGAVDDPVAVATRREAYRIAGNTAALQSLPPPPPRREPVYDAYDQWLKAHPYPGPAAPRADIEAHSRALAGAAITWIAQWPEEPMPYWSRFRALAQLSDTLEADLAAAGQQLIAINSKRPGVFLRTPAYIDVARAYVNRGIRLDAVPGMLDLGIRQAQTTRSAPISDLFDDHNHRLNEQARFQSFLEAAMVKFDWAMKTANIEAARATLPTLRGNLDQLQSITTEPGRAQNFFEAEYWTRMEQLARHEGRVEDVAEYRRAARNARSSNTPAARRPAAARAEGRQVPPLRARSAGGRVFSDRDLDGKVAIISVWATWCAPCISELAALQKLYEELKDANDVIILAFNIDANPGVVEPFLSGRNWTFPVLLTYDYLNSFMPDLSIPRTWIVDGSLIVSEESGFDSAEAWRKRVLAKLAEARQRCKSGR